jgi:NADH dehydrogenase FAD-containing subunit
MDPNEKQKDREPLNIVILGASFAGLAVAHRFLRNTIEELGVTRSAPRYKVILIGPSTCLYWNIGAPRALVSPKLLPLDKVFVPFLPMFEDYLRTRFQHVQGVAKTVDFEARTVLVEEVDTLQTTRWSHNTSNTLEKPRQNVNTKQIINFHALIIATGTSAESPLLSLHGPHEKTIESLQVFHDRVAHASSVIVAGGGPSGIECAGQLATWLHHGKGPTPPTKSSATAPLPTIQEKPSWNLQRFLTFLTSKHQGSAKPNAASASRKTIILISGHDRLLPRLRPEFGAQAEAKLKKLGVNIMHNYRVEKAVETGSGITHCILNDDLTISCDVFVAATGLYPNTSFMPREMLTSSGYVDADPRTLRVPNTPRVFAVGDCASHSKNSIQDVYDSMPILLQNLKNDLIQYELQVEHPYGGEGAETKMEKLEDYAYMQNPTDSQLMPISRFGGVGILFGMKLPSLMVWLMKGRDYRIGRAKLAAGVGKDPYAVI